MNKKELFIKEKYFYTLKKKLEDLLQQERLDIKKEIQLATKVEEAEKAVEMFLSKDNPNLIYSIRCGTCGVEFKTLLHFKDSSYQATAPILCTHCLNVSYVTRDDLIL